MYIYLSHNKDYLQCNILFHKHNDFYFSFLKEGLGGSMLLFARKTLAMPFQVNFWCKQSNFSFKFLELKVSTRKIKKHRRNRFYRHYLPKYWHVKVILDANNLILVVVNSKDLNVSTRKTEETKAELP